MDVFDALQEKTAAALSCAAAVKLFTSELEETDKAIRERIRRQREDTAGKIAYNHVILENPSTNVTQKRIAALELSQLEAQTFTATSEEIIEFNAAKERATTALSDFEKSRQAFRAAHDAAVKELTTLKETVLPAREIRSAHRDRVERLCDAFERNTINGNFT